MRHNGLHKGAGSNIFSKARELRQRQTYAEKVLWERLRNSKLEGFKFRRQHPISDFIADFYCHKARLVIEVDGKVHESREQHNYDTGRTYELESLGLKVVRFKNEEIENDPDKVLAIINQHIVERERGN